MLLLLAKKLIPAPIATGLVGMTVLLTNSRKNPPQTSFYPLFTSSDIDEKEIDPEVPKTPPSLPEIKADGQVDNASSEEEGEEVKNASQNQSSEQQEKPPESTESREKSSEIQTQESSSSISAFSGVEPSDPESLSKMIMEIAARQPVWVSTKPSLISIYEINDRIDGLLSVLKRLKPQQK